MANCFALVLVCAVAPVVLAHWPTRPPWHWPLIEEFTLGIQTELCGNLRDVETVSAQSLTIQLNGNGSCRFEKFNAVPLRSGETYAAKLRCDPPLLFGGEIRFAKGGSWKDPNPCLRALTISTKDRIYFPDTPLRELRLFTFSESTDVSSKTVAEIDDASPDRFAGSHPDSVGVAFGHRVYFFGDAKTSGSFNWWYDVQSNEWHKSQMSGNELPSGLAGPCVVATEDKIYLMGGKTEDGCNNRVYAFDPATEEWAIVANSTMIRCVPDINPICMLSANKTEILFVEPYDATRYHSLDLATNAWNVWAEVGGQSLKRLLGGVAVGAVLNERGFELYVKNASREEEVLYFAGYSGSAEAWWSHFKLHRMMFQREKIPHYRPNRRITFSSRSYEAICAVGPDRNLFCYKNGLNLLYDVCLDTADFSLRYSDENQNRKLIYQVVDTESKARFVIFVPEKKRYLIFWDDGITSVEHSDVCSTIPRGYF